MPEPSTDKAAPEALAQAWDEGVDAAFRGAVMRENADNVKMRNPHRRFRSGNDG